MVSVLWIGNCCAQIYTTFFCRQNEPSYIRSLKLEILAAVADETNAYEIATELTEYVSDPDEQLAREAVRAVGRIAIEARAHCSTFDSFPVYGMRSHCWEPRGDFALMSCVGQCHCTQLRGSLG